MLEYGLPMTRPEDVDLAIEQYDGLNQRFYEGQPHKYFNRRLTSLMLSVSDSDDIRAAMDKGIRFGRIGVSGSEPYDLIEANNYAAAESSVLLHHASEALLRLYFAHEGFPLCPWLEVARLRNFNTFKKKLSDFGELLKDDTSMDSVLAVFRGHHDPGLASFGGSMESWQDQRKALSLLFADVCHRLLAESNLYNAAKHGLALVGGDVGISLGAGHQGAEAILSKQGPSLTYLEVTEQGDKGKRWSQSVSWIEIGSNIALISLVVRQIESLWSIAKARYLDEMGGQVLAFDTDTYMRAITPESDHARQLGKMSESLLYYVEEVSGSAPQDSPD